MPAEHTRLRAAIASFDFTDAKQVRLAYGVAAHDLYHTGQIALVRRLARR